MATVSFLDRYIDGEIVQCVTGTVVDPDEGRKGAVPSPGYIEVAHEKMVAKGSGVDFMILGLPHPLF